MEPALADLHFTARARLLPPWGLRFVEFANLMAIQRPELADAGNHELLEQMRNYHRDEDFKIVKHRDDLAIRDHDEAWQQTARVLAMATCPAPISARSAAAELRNLRAQD